MSEASLPLHTRSTIILSLLIGAGGTMVLGIQPIFLGALLSDHVIKTAELGWIATAEVLANALGIFVGSKMLRGPSARHLIFVAGIVMALANYVTWIAGTMVVALLSRLFAGLAEGLAMAVAVLCITYGRQPGRLNAIFIALGAMLQLIGAYFMPRFGAGVGYAAMGAAGLAISAMALALRQKLAPSREEGSSKIKWTFPVILTLATTLIYEAGVGASWSYVEPFGAELGYHAEQVGIAIMASLAMQIVSTLLVTAIGYRIPFSIALLGGTLLHLISLLLFIEGHTAWMLFASLGGFGFFWAFCVPFTTDLSISVDETRGTAPLLLPLLYIGLSIGAFVASFFVGGSIIGAMHLAVVCFVVSIACYILLFWLTARAASTARLRLSPAVERAGT